ncbi:MAG: transporter [Lachnospiraceae bacterium]|nr:transporter [Lachnospiraceae bacterium]
MQAISTIFPVFFILFLGIHARKKGWINHEQNNGLKTIALDILFPFLIYHIVATSVLDRNIALEIVYLIAVWILVYFLGKMVCRMLPENIREISPFLLLTCEGGAVALPLYLSIVGSSYILNLIPFDLAGILINFIFVPTVLQIRRKEELKLLPLVKKVISAPFVIAAMLAVITNLTGLQRLLSQSSAFGPIYENTMNAIIAPVSGLILFSLGYSIRIKKGYLSSLFKLAVIRLTFCSGIIASFFLVFPEKMQNPVFSLGVILYFYCPTGFPVPLQIREILDTDEKEEFVSAFISLFLLIALVVYVALSFYYKQLP